MCSNFIEAIIAPIPNASVTTWIVHKRKSRYKRASNEMSKIAISALMIRS